MPERIVPVEEAIGLKARIAVRFVHGDNEMNHFTHYYEIASAKNSESCSYCSAPPILLKHERDHRGVNFIALMCRDHAPFYILEKMSAG